MGNGQGQQSGESQATKEPEGQNPQEPTGSSESQRTSPDDRQGPQDGHRATDEGRQSAFSHPRLKGRSPEEIQSLFSTMEETVRSQSRDLNRLASQNSQPRESQQPNRGRETELDEDEFFNRPVSATREIIRQELEETVRPLRETVSSLASRSQMDEARQRLRNQYPDWDRVEPYIEQIVARTQGIEMAHVLSSPGVAENMYWSVKGRLSEGQLGRGPQEPNQPRQPNQQPQQPQGQGSQVSQGRQPPPPQHRPSSSPTPNPQEQSGSSQTRELNEQEKRLAREYGMSDEEYIRWSEMDARDVVDGPRPDQN